MTQLKQVVDGYVSLIKEIFCIRNKREYFRLRMSFWLVIMVLGLIGLLRTLLEVVLGIHLNVKWYSLDLDILFTMFFFTIYFCFFGAFIMHVILRMLGKRIPYSSLFALLFYLQMFHLLVPFLDFIGLRLGIPWYLSLSKPYVSAFFTNALVMTFGIMVVWILAAYILAKIFIRHFKVGILRAVLALLVSFNFFYWPIYHLWPTFNTAANWVFNLQENVALGAHWGYGLFFMLCVLIGVAYYSFQKPQHDKPGASSS